MEQSILKTIKKLCGIHEDDKSFDLDVIVAINSAFMESSQLGIGPHMGFTIEDETAQWTDYEMKVANYEALKTFIYLKVRLSFDPPQNSFLVAEFNKQLEELKFRLIVQADNEGGE